MIDILDRVEILAAITRQAKHEMELIRNADGLRAENRRLQDEIERLLAVVDRLPKTGDGVSMYPGIPVWQWCNGEYSSFLVTWINVDGSRVGTNTGWTRTPSELYSSREAAEKARKA